MSETPQITVVIPTYNRAGLLGQAVHSVLCQEGVSHEIIVVDDGSTDNTREVVQDLQDRIHYIRQVNSGAPAARNTGLKQATGQSIKFLDSDDYLAPGCLQVQWAHLENSNADIVYGQWQEVGLDTPNPDLPPFEMPYDDPIDSLLADWWTPNFSYLIRSDTAKSTGWDESLGSAQDFDYILRLAIRGASFQYVPGPAGFYRFHGQERVSRLQLSSWCRNREKVLSRAADLLLQSDSLTETRRQHLALSLFRLAQAVFAEDRSWFRRLTDKTREIEPGFRPPRKAHALMASLLGLEGAEVLLQARRNYLKKRRSPV